MEAFRNSLNRDHAITELRSLPAVLPGRASVGPRSFGKVADGRQGSAGSSNDPILFHPFPIVAAIAELERNIIVERIRGGIRRAREQGKQLGRRPLTDPNLLRTVLRMKAQGKSIRAIAEAVKVTKSFVHKTCKNCGSQTLESPAFKN